MDWLFHILIALLFYSKSINLTWYLIGSLALDLFFVISFSQASKINLKRALGEMNGESKVRNLFFHKAGYIAHGAPFFAIISITFALSDLLWLKSLVAGMSLHLMIDFLSHNPNPNPLFYPFSNRRYPTGVINWSFRNKRQVSYGLAAMAILLAAKYLIFGFII